jgi:CheY-like chemotaxis protein
MTEINPSHFLEELRYDLASSDLIKARLVMTHFAEMDAQTRRSALYEMSKGPDPFVITLLVGVLSVSQDSGDHIPMLKELLYSKALDNPDVLTRLLMRETNPSHREILAQIAAELKLEAATPILSAMLSESCDEKTLRSALLALGSIGDASAVSAIAKFLYAGSAELVIAAVRSLELLGTPDAIERLFEKLGDNDDLDLLILDVFAVCQEAGALERLNTLLSARHAHLRSAAKQKLIQIGSKAVPVLLNNLRFDDPDLLIHTLNVLGTIADGSAIAPIRKLLHNEPADPNVRFAAYEALGYLPVAQGAFKLAQGLEDPVDHVRAAAARAIDNNYNTVLSAGLKNLIRDEDAHERPVSRIIIDAECNTIFTDLLDDDVFRSFAVAYLSRRAHREIRDHFIGVLKARGHEALAAAIEGANPPPARMHLKVYVVDDSKMVLNIYRSMLHHLGCDPVLFASPADAIRRVVSDPPDLIFTDLNMPDISGVALTRAVRRHFTREQLPVIMVTTQNDGGDTEAAARAGVNAVIHKPFTEAMLQAAMDEVLETTIHRGNMEVAARIT